MHNSCAASSHSSVCKVLELLKLISVIFSFILDDDELNSLANHCYSLCSKHLKLIIWEDLHSIIQSQHFFRDNFHING